jgi:hypothetical protein
MELEMLTESQITSGEHAIRSLKELFEYSDYSDRSDRQQLAF